MIDHALANPWLGTALAAHLLSCAVAVTSAWIILPAHYRRPLHYVGLLLIGLSVFIPVLGCFAVLALAVAARRSAKTQAAAVVPFAAVTPAPFMCADTPVDKTADKYHDVSSRLKQRALTAEAQIQALLSLDAMPGKLKNPVLREILNHPADDIRLLACSMLSQQENILNLRIDAVVKQLNRPGAESLRFLYHKQLAYLYWEFVDKKILLGDVLGNITRSAAQHCEQALGLQNDAALWLLRARIFLYECRLEQAEAALDKAERAGLTSLDSLPYRAELAYCKKDFVTLRTLVFSHAPQRYPLPDGVLRFWNAPAP